nr:reverse transcriptase domain-containing protein [Tanacetum cinerariifolium]
MTAMLKQFQSNPPPAQLKAVEEICITCRGAHPYYQCLAAGGNTFPEYRDNIQGYVLAATGNFNQGNPGYRPQGVANQMRPPEETYTDPDHAEYNIKVPPPPPVQKPNPPIQRNFVIHTRDSLPPCILNYNPKGERFLIASCFPTPPLACAFFNLRATETSSSKLARDQTSNPTSFMNPTPKDTMTDNRTLAEMLRAPTEGCEEAIVVPPILAEQFELTHSLINMMTSKKFFGLELDNPHNHGQPAGGLKKNPHVKAVEEICVTCGGAHLYYQCLAAGGNTFPEYRDNIQGYVLAAAGNYNQGNPGYRPQGVVNQMRLPDFFVQQTNEIKNMMASLLQMNTASTLGLGTLPGNTIANPKGELKAITTCSGLVTEGPTVPNPPKSVNPEEDKCVEETYTDPDHVEYNIKVPPPPPEKLQELANTPLNENCSAVILKKLPAKLGDPGKFLIPCGFSELKCKALADIGASINLMPLSVWKKLGLPDLIPTRMTLQLANRVIYTPDGIARDVFVPVGKFTFPADFVVVDYESDSRVPLILGRPFLRTARALIDVHGEEMILHIDSFNDIDPHFDDDPLSGSTTFLANSLLEEFADELALITYPLDYDDNRVYSIDQSVLTHRDDLFVDPTPKMFTDEQPPDYSFPSRFDVYPDDFLEIESDATFDDDSFDSEGEKIKEAELLIDQLDLPCDIHSEYDSFNSQDFSRDDVLPSPDNADKVFNPGILSHEKSVLIITRVTQEKKLAISFASWLFEDFDPPFYELLVFKEVPNSMRLLLFSSKNEEKVYKQGIYISKKVYCCFLIELSHPGFPVFTVNMFFLSLMKIFHVQNGKNTPLLDVLLFHFYPP